MTTERYDGIGGHWDDDGFPLPHSTNQERIEPIGMSWKEWQDRERSRACGNHALYDLVLIGLSVFIGVVLGFTIWLIAF